MPLEEGAAEAVQEEVQSEVEETQEIEQEPVAEEQSLDGDVSEEEVAELEGDIEDAIEAGASEEEIVDMIREFKFKVNGKEVTKSIDLNDHDAVLRELQRSAGMSQALQDKSSMEKEFNAGLAELLANPEKVLADLDIDVEDFATKILSQRVEEMKKSPEQKEAERVQSELEEARAEVKRMKESAEKSKFDEMVQVELDQFNDEVENYYTSANVVIPRNPDTISKIANALEWAESAVDEDGNRILPEGQRATVADVMPMIESEYIKNIGQLLEDAPNEVFERVVGKGRIDKYRKSKIPKKPAPNNLNSLKQTAQVPSGEKEDKKGKLVDYFRTLEKEYGA